MNLPEARCSALGSVSPTARQSPADCQLSGGESHQLTSANVQWLKMTTCCSEEDTSPVVKMSPHLSAAQIITSRPLLPPFFCFLPSSASSLLLLLSSGVVTVTNSSQASLWERFNSKRRSTRRGLKQF
ncbi:hypothetical protein F2P81_013970 [Scophthalmus maximus]|uniref:Uncharacterized protein n=1 Tax=Scophthalmus maximus TaxID=52904 RepID=A0A6A4SS83_SCOMX|nr:hypothetical protein F2P81_013970 [Scophthalmus maximus]